MFADMRVVLASGVSKFDFLHIYVSGFVVGWTGEWEWEWLGVGCWMLLSALTENRGNSVCAWRGRYRSGKEAKDGWGWDAKR